MIFHFTLGFQQFPQSYYFFQLIKTVGFQELEMLFLDILVSTIFRIIHKMRLIIIPDSS